MSNISPEKLVDLIIKQVGIGFQATVWALKKIIYIENSFLSGVARFVDRKITPLVDKSSSSSLNGSDLEQISHNRVVIFSLEVAELLNKLFDEMM